MKLVKKILAVIAVILLIYGAFVFRRILIFRELKEKTAMYKEKNNYYVKISTMDGSSTTTETYRNGAKYLVKLAMLEPNGTTRTLINYCDGQTVNTYIETSQAKVAVLNSNGIPSPAQVTDYFEGMSVSEMIELAMCSSVVSENVGGKECYKIAFGFPSSMFLYPEDDDENVFYTYFDKETGLMIKFGDTNFEYQFDCVTEKNLKEPNRQMYEIKEI